MDDDGKPSAFDEILGASPHLALMTEYGLFCPACSDPFKLSFVPAINCALAAVSQARTDQHQPWREIMIQAGLKILTPAARTATLDAHHEIFHRANKAWKETYTDPQTDS